MIIGYYPDKYIAPSGDTTGVTDTARFNEALAKKGTIVLAEDAKYTINSTITIDPAHVMLFGNGSLITALQTGTAIKLDSTGSTNYKRTKSRSIGNFTLRANTRANTVGMLLETPTNGDRSTSPVLHNISIENCAVGVRIGANAYLVTFRDVDIGWCDLGIQRTAFQNNGEQIKYDGGSIFNGGRAFWFGASNGELRFFGTSFDYNQMIGYTDAIVEAHGCHFESNSNVTTGKRQFEVDNGGNMAFFGGDIGLVDWNNGNINTAKPPATHLFTVWGQGGSFTNFGLRGHLANHYTQKLCNKDNGLTQPRMFEYNQSRI